MWAMLLNLIFGALPSLATAAITAYNKTIDAKVEKYKIDGTVDLAAIQAQAQVEQAQAQVIIAEQGKWYTPRNLLSYTVAIWFFSAVAFDKVVGPKLFHVHTSTDDLGTTLSTIAGIIISGLFLHGVADLVTQRWARS